MGRSSSRWLKSYMATSMTQTRPCEPQNTIDPKLPPLLTGFSRGLLVPWVCFHIIQCTGWCHVSAVLHPRSWASSHTSSSPIGRGRPEGRGADGGVRRLSACGFLILFATEHDRSEIRSEKDLKRISGHCDLRDYDWVLGSVRHL